MEFVTGFKDHNQIVKGKRTKRQRSLSPFGVAAVNSGSCSSSGYSGGGGGGSGGGGGERGVVYDDCCYNSVVSSSPTTSGEIYESTEEEEDMANCLIMLAQGDAPARHRGNMIRTGKFTSKKFSGVATTSTTDKAGFYVYECKTCNRSFPSFQALGGHRASHKRPKAAAAEDQKKPSMVFPPLKDELEDASPPPPPPPFSLQAGTATKASKIHECSICGSEFTSGQALGGHMRRHRAATPNNQVVLTSTSTIESNSRHHHDIKPRSILPTLDLNLPAPEDDHLRDSKFQFGSSTQQAHSLVFSAPALVDCHY